MKQLLFALLFLAVLTSCDKTEVQPNNLAESEAFFIGAGGGWGADLWYRITDDQVEKFASEWLYTIPPGGYADDNNWNPVEDSELLTSLLSLQNDFPADEFSGVEQNGCPEVAVDGVCIRVGYGPADNPTEANIWFRNTADNPAVNDYLTRVREVLYGE